MTSRLLMMLQVFVAPPQKLGVVPQETGSDSLIA
jgi:hypothetical protein